MLAVARFVNLLSTGLLAGLLLDFWLFVAPSLPDAVPQELNRRYLIATPALYAVINVSALAVLILLRRRSGVAFGLTAAALLCGAVATAVTLLVNVPVGNWALADPVRSGLVIAAFACQVLAVLSTPRRAV